MSCNRTICSIWHECDKALGEELKPLCAEENFNRLQQIKTEITEIVDDFSGPLTGEDAREMLNRLRQLSAV